MGVRAGGRERWEEKEGGEGQVEEGETRDVFIRMGECTVAPRISPPGFP